MTAIVTDSRFWSALRRIIEDKHEADLTRIKKAVDEKPYHIACGRIAAFEEVMEEAKDIIKQLNAGTLDEEESA